MKKRLIIITLVVISIGIIAIYHKNSIKYQLYQLSKTNSEITDIYNNYQQYPKDILELLINNTETINFVKYYPHYIQNPTIPDSIGSLNDEIPLLLQWDQRWGYLPFGDHCIAINGSAPTCLSMVISYLTQDNTITPYTISQYMIKGNINEMENFTSFHVKAKEISLSKDAIIEELKQNHPIICLMQKGDFTDDQHFIVITQYIDNKFKINDPNSIIRSQKLWDYDTLVNQISKLWSYSLIS